MEPPKRNGQPNPLRRHANAGILSRLSFSWAWPLIRRGYSRDKIEHKDMFKHAPSEHSSCLWKRIDREWTREQIKKKTGRTPSLPLALARAYGLYYALCAIPIFIECVAYMSRPILFRAIIDHFSPDSTVSRTQAYWCASGVALAMLIDPLMGPYSHFRHVICVMQWRGGLTALLYRKVMRLSNKTLKKLTTGHIVDVITGDTDRITEMIWRLHNLWRAPLNTIVAVTFIYSEIGAPALLALGLILGVIPLQILLARIMAVHRTQNSKITDERVTTMGEIISSIRVIKMYCWEKPFGKLVDEIRKKEVDASHTIHMYNTFVGQLTHFATRLVSATVVVTYALLYGPLPAAKIFPIFMFMDNISNSLLNDLAWGVVSWFSVGVSVKRIHEFLELEERAQSEALTYEPVAGPETRCGVTVCNLVARWDESSLLLSLIGELPITSGRVQCVGKMAYAAQQPWAFSSNIRQNILFGSPYDEAKYTNVIAACSLSKDLGLLPHGDKTLVGEKGVTLSGGQKARISLARALYSDADVYLMDDPLSAVDAAVGRHIFDKCINGHLKKKARILVTHQLQYLSKADRILVLHEGHVQFCGTYEAVVQSGIDLCQLVVADSTDESSSTTSSQVQKGSHSEIEVKEEAGIEKQLSVEAEEEEEEDANSAVNWYTLWLYFRAGNGFRVLLFLCFVIGLEQLTNNISDWFLAQWTNDHSSYTSAECGMNDSFSRAKMAWTTPEMTSPHQPTGVTSLFDDTVASAIVHTCIVIGVLVLTRVRIHAFMNMSAKSSTALHDMMFQAVTRAPSRFFDTNPKGRILNYFSGDLASVDGGMHHTLQHFTRVIVSGVGNLVLVCILCPAVFIATLPVFAISMFLRTFYIRAQRHCRRLLSASGSPMVSHLNATLEGMETIRAFKSESRCSRDFDLHDTFHTSTWLNECSVYFWFIFLANGLGALYSSFVVFSCLMTTTDLDAGDVGMVLRYAMGMCWTMSEVAKTSAEFEMQIAKTGRVLQYTKLPPEAPLETRYSPPPTWPSGGAIIFEDVCLRYHDNGPTVLENLNFKIKAGEKVGIVGRTGAGKSSLIQALFRMTEPSGHISIDGIYINKLGLHTLRKNVSIIPQDPVMFGGTVKRNLDPFEECETTSIWWALEEVQLRNTVETLPDGLDSKVDEGGTNFSVGQRQLFCLARALLRKNKILVLDEATANVDKRTDDMIQSTIRHKFQDCTVLTIAHRLNTVMDSDRILVMDEGRVAQLDDPASLLDVTEGSFYKMLKKMGPGEQQRLTSLAREARDRREWTQGSDELRERFMQSGE